MNAEIMGTGLKRQREIKKALKWQITRLERESSFSGKRSGWGSRERDAQPDLPSRRTSDSLSGSAAGLSPEIVRTNPDSAPTVL